MIVENWFYWTLIATIFAGMHVFLQKVGSKRGYSSNLLNTYSTLISGLIGLIIIIWTGELYSVSWLILIVGTINGAIYLIGSGLRMEAMKYIDTTILLPLHKFLSPIFALFIGILFFGELFTTKEWIGIGLGILVPLLLISRSEKDRQNNLSKGLVFLTISAFIVATNAAVSKEGVIFFNSVLMFATVSHLGSVPLGLIFHKVMNNKSNSSHHAFDKGLIKISFVCGIIQFISYYTFLYAFAAGGPLAIVYTIHSLYIVIPIVMSIIIYNEHCNLRKVIAIVLSMGAIALLR